MKPLVSAIIPTYNRADLVTEAIGSVLGQTYKNVEVIIVDDGSTDNTKETLEKYENKIRYFCKDNGGNADARNYGIRKARGEYIAFLDHDDMWYPERLEKLVGFLENNGQYGAVMSETEYIDMEGRTLRYSNYREGFPANGTDMPYALRNLPGCFSNLVARREVVERVGKLDENLKAASDLDYFLRITIDSKISLYPECLLKYRKTESSLSNNLFTKNRLGVLNKFTSTHPRLAAKYRNIIRDTIAAIHLSYAEDLLWNRYTKEARAEIMESMRNKLLPKALSLYLKSWFMRSNGSLRSA